MPETTENYHHIPVAKKKEGNPLRTISLGKGVKAIYDYKRKIIVTYLFDVDKYTMKQAKEWVKKHKSSAAHLQVIDNLSLAIGLRELNDAIISEISERLHHFETTEKL